MTAKGEVRNGPLASRWTSAALAAAALACFSLYWGDGLKGGVSLVGAERVLAGEFPYRDFWTLYAPGSYYLLAGLFALFGTQLAVGAVAGSLLCAAGVGLAHRLFLHLSRPGLALLAAVVFAAALFSTPFTRYLGTYPPVLCCLLLAWLALVAFFRTARERALVLAGLAIGTAALFKHDVGAYTGLAATAGLVTHAALVRDGRGLARLLRLAGATALPFVPVAAVLLALAGRELLESLIVFPATDFRHARPESFPSLLPGGWAPPGALKRQVAFNAGNWLAFALPFAIWLAGIAAGLRALAARDAARAGLLVAFAVGFAGHWFAAHTQINTHVVSMTLYALGLALLLLQGLPERARRFRILAAALAVGWAGALVLQPSVRLARTLGQERVALALPKLSGVRLSPGSAAQLEELAAYVHERVPPGTPIYSGLDRHDIVILNDVVLYFWLDRPPATRYHELHPGIADTAAGQREIVAELREQEVPLLVLWNRFPDDVLDEVKRRHAEHLDIGATELDRFIAAHYQESRRFGRYTVWVLRDGG